MPITDERSSSHQCTKQSFTPVMMPPETFSRGTTPDGMDIVAINARCLDHVDVSLLTPTPYDGASA